MTVNRYSGGLKKFELQSGYHAISKIEKIPRDVRSSVKSQAWKKEVEHMQAHNRTGPVIRIIFLKVFLQYPTKHWHWARFLVNQRLNGAMFGVRPLVVRQLFTFSILFSETTDGISTKPDTKQTPWSDPKGLDPWRGHLGPIRVHL